MAAERSSAFSLAGGRSSGPHIRVPVTGRGLSFTLIELIAVLAVVGVLLALGLGAAAGARERARLGQARAELATFAQALESFRRQYGDYPQTGAFAAKGAAVVAGDPVAVGDAEAKFFNALLGKLDARAQPLRDRAGEAVLGRPWVEAARQAVEAPAVYPSAGAEAANAFLDPWGRRYQYAYRDAGAPAGWRAAGYVLFSVGPDGAAKPGDPTAAGAVDAADPRNADNLYAE